MNGPAGEETLAEFAAFVAKWLRDEDLVAVYPWVRLQDPLREQESVASTRSCAPTPDSTTFTETRFIVYDVKVNTDNDDVLDTGSWQGGWTDNGASITRIEPGHVDVAKQYVLAGDLLAINPWGDNEPNEELDVYTRRCRDPLPGGILGSWTCRDT